jgi:pyochelin synthetase
MDGGPEQMIAVLGTLLSGAAYLPIDSKHPVSRRNQMLAEAQVRTVLTQSWLSTDALPSFAERIDVDLIPSASSPLTRHGGTPEDLAYVIYTSGSTGVPKGVMISHGAARNTIDDINRRFQVCPEDRLLGISNLSFDLSVYDVFGPLGAGGCLVLPDPDRRDDPSHWANLIRECGVTIWNSVPAKMQMLLDHLDSQELRSPLSLRLILLSGDWIPVSLAARIRERIPNAETISLGGATEASIWSIFHPIKELPAGLERIPYGKPLANQTFHVLDAALRACPDWTLGELYIGGAGLSIGYLGDEATTTEKFICHPESRERLYRTGDIGRYLPDGNIEILGREDFQVKIHGHRIEPAEIEAALQSHPAVATGAVIVHEEGFDSKRLAAFVEAKRCARTAVQSQELADRLTAIAENAAAEVTAGVDCDRVVSYARQLDHTALLAMVHVLREHGLFIEPKDSHSLEEILSRLRVAPRHHRLVSRWLNALLENGMLHRMPSTSLYYGAPAIDGAAVDEGWRAAERLQPEMDRRTELLDYFRVASWHLPELLRGELDPLQLLFPQGRVDIHEVAYNDNFLSRYLNRLASTLVCEIAALHSKRDLSILEVGAGVGGTSAVLIPETAGFCSEYLFTDVSQFFLNNASERFSRFPWVRYGLFDINQDYRSQGFASNTFDVILCANVLHYALNVSSAIERLREMLNPGGWLVLIEMVRDNYQVLTSMEFLFDETVVDFTDVRQGRAATFISLDQWYQLLSAAGAEPILSLPRADDVLSQVGFRVFGAQYKADRHRLDKGELMAHLRLRLPAYMLPSSIEVVDALPRNENGKIDRKRLTSWLSSKREQTSVVTYEEPATDLERRIADVWSTVLKLPHVGRNQDFFALGGDSLIASQLVGRVREQIPEAKDLFFDMLLRIMLDGPTVADLANTINEARLPSGDGESNGNGSPLRRLLEPCEGTVLVLVHDSSGTLASYEGLLSALAGAGEKGVVGLFVNDTETYLKLPPEVIFQRAAADYAGALGELKNSRLHLVGYEAGGLLAAELARCLFAVGQDVALTLISSAPLSYVIEDDLLAEYLSMLSAGVDPMRAGFPSEASTARALTTILSGTRQFVPAGSLARVGGDSDLDGVAWCFRRLTRRSKENRLETMAHLLASRGTKPMNLSEISALIDVFLHTMTAATLVDLSPYPGAITLLRPSEPSQIWRSMQDDAATFWRARCLGALHTIDIPGNHFTCLKPPNGLRVEEILTLNR